MTEGPGARDEVLLSCSLLEGDQPLAAVRQTQRVRQQFVRGNFPLPVQTRPGIVMSLVEEEPQHWRPGLRVEVPGEDDGQGGVPGLDRGPVQFSLITR